MDSKACSYHRARARKKTIQRGAVGEVRNARIPARPPAADLLVAKLHATVARAPGEDGIAEPPPARAMRAAKCGLGDEHRRALAAPGDADRAAPLGLVHQRRQLVARLSHRILALLHQGVSTM